MTEVRKHYDEHLGPIYEWMERSESGWNLTVSSSEKLRLNPRWVAVVAQESGLRIIVDRTQRGLVTIAFRLGEVAFRVRRRPLAHPGLELKQL